MKDIKLKFIETTIPENTYISRIESVIGNVKNITFRGTVSNMHVYEFEKGMMVLLEFTDETGTIPALMIGYRNNDFKVFLDDLKMNHTYRVTGNVKKVEEVDEQLPFTKELLNKSILCVKAIDD